MQLQGYRKDETRIAVLNVSSEEKFKCIAIYEEGNPEINYQIIEKDHAFFKWASHQSYMYPMFKIEDRQTIGEKLKSMRTRHSYRTGY